MPLCIIPYILELRLPSCLPLVTVTSAYLSSILNYALTEVYIVDISSTIVHSPSHSVPCVPLKGELNQEPRHNTRQTSRSHCISRLSRLFNLLVCPALPSGNFNPDSPVVQDVLLPDATIDLRRGTGGYELLAITVSSGSDVVC
jgi:hypothetical protein